MEIIDPAAAAAYEPPSIESVLVPEQIEREVHYAGEPSPNPK